MSIQLSDLRLILGRVYLLKCTKTSECRHKLISWSVMLNLFLPFLYKIAPLKSCGDQWPEQQLQVSNYFSMAGGQERNLKIEESLPLGTTKVGVEEKMELKRTRVLKLGLKEIAWSIFWLPACNSISWLQYQYSLIESIFAKICRFFRHTHTNNHCSFPRFVWTWFKVQLKFPPVSRDNLSSYNFCFLLQILMSCQIFFDFLAIAVPDGISKSGLNQPGHHRADSCVESRKPGVPTTLSEANDTNLEGEEVSF